MPETLTCHDGDALQMRTAMLTHFNLQTPHHEGTGLRTPAPPRAKRIAPAQPSGRATVASASTADSRCAMALVKWVVLHGTADQVKRTRFGMRAGGQLCLWCLLLHSLLEAVAEGWFM